MIKNQPTKFFTLFYIIFLYCNQQIFGHEPPRIAIIGNGISGTICAKFLSELIIESKITIFDHESYDDETRGLKFSSEDQYIQTLANELNLAVNISNKNLPSAIFTNSGFQILEANKFYIKYPKSYSNLLLFMLESAKNFKNIYDLQKNKKSFKTISELLSNLDSKFSELLCKTSENFLNEDVGELEDDIKKFVQLLLKANYGLNLNHIHGFTGWHSLYQTELIGGSLKTITEDLPKILEKDLLEKSNIQIKSKRIIKWIINRDNFVSIITATIDNVQHTDLFDYVIIAAPAPVMNQNSFIKISNFKKFPEVVYNFSTSKSSLVIGNLREKFELKNDNNIIINLNNNNSFDTMQKIQPLTNNSPTFRDFIWMINSKDHLSNDFLNDLFHNPRIIESLDVFSYPNYSNFDCENDPSFILSDKLYHVNAIDWAANSIEMKAIGAKNVALLIYHDIDKINQSKATKSESELIC